MTLHFRLTGRAEDLDLGPDPDEGDVAQLVTDDIALHVVGDPSGDVVIVASTEREIVEADAQPFMRRNADITEGRATGTIGPRRRHLADREGILRHLRDVGSGRLRVDDVFPSIEPFTEQDVEWLIDAPEEVLAISEPIHATLRAAATRFVQIARWVFSRPFPAQALTAEQFEWSIDRSAWHLAPSREEDIETFGEPGQYLNPRAFGAIQALMADPTTAEPVARQILLEAVALYDANPRAALVLAVAAAEIGVRDAAQVLTGDRLSEQWLLSRRSAPTVDDFLTGYLPLVTKIRTSDGASTVVPESLRNRLREAANLRNKAVHRGQAPPSTAYVSQLVKAVNDLLYLLDWMCGHEWAATRVSEPIRSAYPLTH